MRHIWKLPELLFFLPCCSNLLLKKKKKKFCGGFHFSLSSSTSRHTFTSLPRAAWCQIDAAFMRGMRRRQASFFFSFFFRYLWCRLNVTYEEDRWAVRVIQDKSPCTFNATVYSIDLCSEMFLFSCCCFFFILTFFLVWQVRGHG